VSELETVRGLARGALEALEQSRERIDDLNVYPVPDGDTGTNLTLTARGVVEALDASTAADWQALAREATRAALMSARGNSGVILSQIVRGAAEALAGSNDLALAFRGASDAAYAAVRKPVEGTMLTVIRSLAEAAEAAPALEPAELLALLVERGEEAVARTQEQLDVLREAGVVDAGGAGLVELVRGLAAAAAGEEPVPRAAPPPRLSLEAVHQEPSRYRYCTTFVVEGAGLDAAALEPELDRLGDSLLVVGDPSALKVHVHTDDPGAALSLGTRVGTIEASRSTTCIARPRSARAAAGGAARRRVTLGRRRRGRRRGQPPPVHGSRRGADRRGRPDDEPVHGRPARSRRRDRR
jgi:DAK2 domain fusion protein YloV